MKISYAIPVCNEHEELDRLLRQLIKIKKDNDEIVVQCDKGNTTREVFEVILKHCNRIKVIQFPLNGNFAEFKNNLKNNCSGDWIFQIDADEYLHDSLAENIHEILEANDSFELFLIPRINTVDGLTQDHIKKWGWRVENDRVNFPDYQTRIIKNLEKIKWINKVHEKIVGYTIFSPLPAEDEYCLYHPKTIERQEKQNNYYDTI